MHLTFFDWAIMVAFFVLSLGIGVAVARQAGRSFSSFFLGNRNMPWWLLGISMVATTFSTDTPNLVADIVRGGGVFRNWVWWAFLLTGMLTVFLYAKLWRRSNVFTDIEFYEIRYSGKPAAFLRGFRAAYLGIFFNVMIMAAVTLAAIKIGGVLMGLTPLQTVIIAATVTVIYSALGGLTGVLLTDLFQFIMAMVGSVAAAWYILNLPEVGGLAPLLENPDVQPYLSFLPPFAEISWAEMMAVFILPLSVQWWAAYYPGAEPGGGGYIVQRMLSAKNERHAVGATLLFNVTHYAIRPWPWILIALASLVVFPDLVSLQERFPHIPAHVIRHDLAYPAMLTLLPAGLLGLVVTSLAAAYMSTMSTQVNWGSSIIVNDIYRRFFNPGASERRLVWMGRVWTLVLMVTACSLALILQSALQMFEILLQVGAGTGLLLLLRWFWWRVNAATEITAMVVSFLVAVFFAFVAGQTLDAWVRLLVGVGITTASWLVVAFITPPTEEWKLREFYARIQPGGPGWRRVIERARGEGVELHDPAVASDLPAGLAAAVFGAIGIYSILFATGFFVYGRPLAGTVLAVVALAAGAAVMALWKKLSFDTGPAPAPHTTRDGS
jgi:solute:Na+ symporter, SSS family